MDERTYPGIVFLHGLNTDSREFMDFPEKLATLGYVVLIFDYSGHGKSEGTKKLFTQKSHFCDSLSAINRIEKEGVGNITVLGHSLGAYAAFLMLKHSEKVKNAIIVAPQIKSGDNLSFMKKVLLKLVGNCYRLLGKWMKDYYYRLDVDYENNYENPDAVERAKRAGFISDSINLRFAAYSLKINNMETAREINKPVLFVVSEKDRDVQPERSEKVYDVIKSKRKRMLRLTNSGHSPFDDFDKERLLKEINKFLKEVYQNG